MRCSNLVCAYVIHAAAAIHGEEQSFPIVVKHGQDVAWIPHGRDQVWSARNAIEVLVCSGTISAPNPPAEAVIGINDCSDASEGCADELAEG